MIQLHDDTGCEAGTIELGPADSLYALASKALDETVRGIQFWQSISADLGAFRRQVADCNHLPDGDRADLRTASDSMLRTCERQIDQHRQVADFLALFLCPVAGTA